MNVIDATQPTKLNMGDYVHFGDGLLYQVRGNGNRPQLYLIGEYGGEVAQRKLALGDSRAAREVFDVPLVDDMQDEYDETVSYFLQATGRM